MHIKREELEDIARKAVLGFGYDADETETILRVLMYAQLRGNNQGVVKLIGRGIPKGASGPIAVEKDTKISALLNGHENHAMVVVSRATDVAIEKAKAHGVGMVGVNHLNTSSGAIGYYAKKIAEAGLIGFVFAGSMETVAPEGSSEPLFGTNPLAIGVPSEGDAVVLDMATSAMAYYGVVEANTAGRELLEGVAYDKNGAPTVRPSDVLDGGALRTFDHGPKGSGLSMMVQILTGPLVGSYFTGIGDVEKNWGGHFILAFDPELLGGIDAFRRGVTQMAEKLKAVKPLSGVEEVFVPGERGDRRTREAIVSGELEIDDALLIELKRSLGEVV